MGLLEDYGGQVKKGRHTHTGSIEFADIFQIPTFDSDYSCFLHPHCWLGL